MTYFLNLKGILTILESFYRLNSLKSSIYSELENLLFSSRNSTNLLKNIPSDI